jgi:hypothetical protein
MAANRPYDLDPEGWYEAAVRIDQNRVMNATFRGSIEAPNANRPLPCEPTTSEAKPKLSDVAPKSDERWDVTDIKGMSADDICWLLQQLSEVDKPPTPTLHPKTPKTPATPTTPPHLHQPISKAGCRRGFRGQFRVSSGIGSYLREAAEKTAVGKETPKATENWRSGSRTKLALPAGGS